MHYGFVLGGDIQSIPELTAEAEAAGWDGVFIPDCISIETPEYPAAPGYDPWIMLTLMAVRTERVRLGTMLTSPSRRRPWKLARETVTLDHLSHGRLVLPLGLGAAEDDAGFYKVGEAMDRKTRAQLMDESIDILTGLWSGKPFAYDGVHYHIQEMTLLPPPVQQPRIPIWVVGAWPRMQSMRRVLKCDGIMPARTDGPVMPTDIQAIKSFVEQHRPLTNPFDIVWEGETPGDNPAKASEILRPWIDAGITWWLETRWGSVSPEEVRKRIQQGPPRS